MLKKLLVGMLSVMIIGVGFNGINTTISREKQQPIEIAELGSGDISPVLFVIDNNQEG